MYPINLKIKNKKCLVIGGGKVGYRKVKSLLKSGAKVTIISKEFESKFKTLKKIKKIQRNFKVSDIKNYFLVIAATNDRKLNEKIFKLCEKKNILVNIVDCPDLCNFFVPSSIQRGDFLLTISTNGKAPFLAKKIRKELEKNFDGFDKVVNVISKYRNKIKNKKISIQEKSKIYEKLFTNKVIDLIRKNKIKQAEELILKKIRGI